MGSRNPERDRFLLSDQTTIYEWFHTRADWAAQVTCSGCAWQGWYVYVQDHIRGHNPPYDVAGLKLRLQCPKCGSPAKELHARFVGLRR